MALEEVLAIAEKDSDKRIQSWAMTWAMNPQPPKKMPNTTARVELEESVSMRDLMKRANGANNSKLRRLYLSMISRATYGDDDDDWEEVRNFYRTLRSDDERALVITPLAREDDAKPFLWHALAGEKALCQAAIKGFLSLASQRRNSPERIAKFLLLRLADDRTGVRATNAIETLSRLNLPEAWRPAVGWDSTFSQVFQNAGDLAVRAKILTLLMAIDPSHIANGVEIKQVLIEASGNPDPRLYASLLALNPRLGITVEMEPPEQATIDGVLARLPHAAAARGRELFFSKSSATRCVACHRVAGRGNNFAPDLSGIGLRSEPRKIVQSILDPSATITEGFQLQTFFMTDGTSLSGAVLREDDGEIRLVKADGTLEVIAVRSVEERKKTKLSAMPTGFELLGNDQIADITAFLATCRHGSAEP